MTAITFMMVLRTGFFPHMHHMMDLLLGFSISIVILFGFLACWWSASHALLANRLDVRVLKHQLCTCRSIALLKVFVVLLTLKKMLFSVAIVTTVVTRSVGRPFKIRQWPSPALIDGTSSGFWMGANLSKNVGWTSKAPLPFTSVLIPSADARSAD